MEAEHSGVARAFRVVWVFLIVEGSVAPLGEDTDRVGNGFRDGRSSLVRSPTALPKDLNEHLLGFGMRTEAGKRDPHRGLTDLLDPFFPAKRPYERAQPGEEADADFL